MTSMMTGIKKGSFRKLMIKYETLKDLDARVR